MQSYCSFYLDEVLLGIEIARVEEILPPMSLTRVPLSNPSIEGLINLRGQIVTAINLRTRLMTRMGLDKSERIYVVVNSSQGMFSLIADRIGDVIEVDPATIEKPLSTLPHPLREVLHGVFQCQGNILHSLNVDRILASFVN